MAPALSAIFRTAEGVDEMTTIHQIVDPVGKPRGLACPTKARADEECSRLNTALRKSCPDVVGIYYRVEPLTLMDGAK